MNFAVTGCPHLAVVLGQHADVHLPLQLLLELNHATVATEHVDAIVRAPGVARNALALYATPRASQPTGGTALKFLCLAGDPPAILRPNVALAADDGLVRGADLCHAVHPLQRLP
jgi:hypothetical protein